MGETVDLALHNLRAFCYPSAVCTSVRLSVELKGFYVVSKRLDMLSHFILQQGRFCMQNGRIYLHNGSV